jgi:hypothetical protein
MTDDAMEMIWKAVIVPGGTEKNHENPQSV